MDIRHIRCGELAAICDSATAGDLSINDDVPSCETTPCMVVVDGDGMIRQWALGDDPAMVDEWQDIGDPVPCQRRVSTITVYWDEMDDVWALRTTDAKGNVSRGTVCVPPESSIADAIDEACYQLDVELTHDDFAIDGMLCADWAAEVVA